MPPSASRASSAISSSARKPHYIAVAFDESLTTSFRNQIYPAYKANRDPPPADLKLQFERCREFCRHAGIPAFSHAEYEADDIVGTLMTRCRREGLPATLVTRDKDFAQLIRAGDVYWDYTDNAHYRYTRSRTDSASRPNASRISSRSWATASTTSRACRASARRPPRRS